MGDNQLDRGEDPLHCGDAAPLVPRGGEPTIGPSCCIVVHALFDRKVEDIFDDRSVQIVSTDTVAHGTNAIALADDLAKAVEEMCLSTELARKPVQ